MAIINGTNGADTLQGTPSADSINARAGDDLIAADAGNDRILAGDGADQALGEDGDDTIFGGNGRDDLSGGLGNDRLFGEQGRDRLTGGEGDDALNGGTGRDTFIINPNDGRDAIRDFTPGQDTILLSGFDQIQSFDDLEPFIKTVAGNSVIDLSDTQGLPPGAQVLTVLSQTALDANDFDFSAGPILFALVNEGV